MRDGEEGGKSMDEIFHSRFNPLSRLSLLSPGLATLVALENTVAKTGDLIFAFLEFNLNSQRP